MADSKLLGGNSKVSNTFSWILLGLMALVGLANLIALNELWALFAFITVFIAIIPTIIKRDLSAVIPWEILLIVALPHLTQLFDVYSDIASYIALVGLALIVTIEIERFTDIEMTSRFAVIFIVLTTMAMSGIWAIAQYFSDVLVGTSFVIGIGELMWDMIIATAAGIIGGIGFEIYFREYTPGNSVSKGDKGDI